MTGIMIIIGVIQTYYLERFDLHRSKCARHDIGISKHFSDVGEKLILKSNKEKKASRYK
jgi:hypothetical protein